MKQFRILPKYWTRGEAQIWGNIGQNVKTIGFLIFSRIFQIKMKGNLGQNVLKDVLSFQNKTAKIAPDLP